MKKKPLALLQQFQHLLIGKLMLCNQSKTKDNVETVWYFH